MRILGPVVQPATGFPLAEGSKVLQGRAVGRQAIGHDRPGMAVALERFPEEFRFADLRFNAAFLSRRFVTKLSSPRPRGRRPARGSVSPR
jgi:hypothetical protein